MARVVVIASSEVPREAFENVLSPDDELHVLVPAVEQSRLDWLANDEGDARARAQDVGETLERRAPIEASTVEVRPDDATQMLVDAIGEHDPDRIVLALRRGEEATWLEEGVLESVPAELEGIPVTRVVLHD